MRAVYMLRSRSEDSDESGNDSDCSMKSGTKKVQFCGGCKDEAKYMDKDLDNSKQHILDKHKCDNRKLHKRGGVFNITQIDRGDIPNGSDVFRQVLKELQTQSDDEVCTPRSDCDTPSKPLKSILKKHKCK